MILTILAALATAAQPTAGARQQPNVIMPEDARQRQFQQDSGDADEVGTNGRPQPGGLAEITLVAHVVEKVAR